VKARKRKRKTVAQVPSSNGTSGRIPASIHPPIASGAAKSSNARMAALTTPAATRHSGTPLTTITDSHRARVTVSGWSASALVGALAQGVQADNAHRTLALAERDALAAAANLGGVFQDQAAMLGPIMEAMWQAYSNSLTRQGLMCQAQANRGCAQSLLLSSWLLGNANHRTHLVNDRTGYAQLLQPSASHLQQTMIAERTNNPLLAPQQGPLATSSGTAAAFLPATAPTAAPPGPQGAPFSVAQTPASTSAPAVLPTRKAGDV